MIGSARVWAFALAVLFQLAPAGAQRIEAPNSGFEAASTSGWKFYRFGGDPFDYEFTDETEHVRSGRYALAITPHGPDRAGKGGLFIKARIDHLEVNSFLSTGLYWKAEGVQLADSQELRPFMEFQDEDGRTIERHRFSGVLGDAATYTRAESINPVPPGAYFAQIELVFEVPLESGSLYLDDFTFEVVVPEDPEDHWPFNGGFEAGDTSGWEFYRFDGDPFAYEITSDPQHVHSGRYALAITPDQPTGSSKGFYIQARIDHLEAGSYLSSSLYYKAEGFRLADAQELRPFMEFLDEAGSTIQRAHFTSTIADAADFTKIESISVIPPEAHYVQMEVVFNAPMLAGVLYLDDFTFEVIPDTNPAPNLLPNGGFELGQADGWAVFNPSNVSYTWAVTSNPDEAYLGQYAARIQVLARGSADDGIIVHTRVPVYHLPADSLVKVSMVIKTDNLQFVRHQDSLEVSSLVFDAGGETLQGSAFNGNFAGTYDWTPVEWLMRLPVGAHELALHLGLEATTSGTVYVDDIIVVPYDPPQDYSYFPDACVQSDDSGTPRLYMDGHAIAPLMFFGTHGNPVIYDEVALAASAGVNIFHHQCGLPWSSNSGPSTGMMQLALARNPDAYFLPRVYLGQRPEMWIKDHPDQLILTHTGEVTKSESPISLASDLYFDILEREFEVLIRLFHSQPIGVRIIGYQFGPEWFYGYMHSEYFDYSEVNRQRFITWLQGRYDGDIAALNSAWPRDYHSFEKVTVPPAWEWERGDDGFFRDPTVGKAVPDYLEYHNGLVAERIIQLSDCIKRLTDGRSLTMSFYGYLNELTVPDHGQAHSGHLALKKLLASESVDMICSPMSYCDRFVGDPSNFMAIVDTVALHGKVYLHEHDITTFMTDPIRADGVAIPGEWDTHQMLRRNFGNILAHNMGMWWMDILSDGTYNDSTIWETNGLMAGVCRDCVDREIAYRPQVALVYDEEEQFWLRSDSLSLVSVNQCFQRTYFQALGAPVGYYFVEDIDRIPDSVKLFVFVNTFRLTEEERAKIETLKGQGRTLVWEYAPGYVTEESLSVAAMETLTGFPLRRQSWEVSPTVMVYASGSSIAGGLAGHRFGGPEHAQVEDEAGKPISPTFVGDEARGGFDIAGRFQSSGQPALMVKRFDDWTSIFCSAPSLSVPVLRAIAREAGVRLLVNPADLFTEDAVNYNGRYLFVYARQRSGTRTFRVGDEPVDVVEIVSGQVMGHGVVEWSCWFEENEQKTFKITAAEE